MLDENMRDLSAKEGQEFATPANFIRKDNEAESYHEALLAPDVDMKSEQEEPNNENGAQDSRPRSGLKSDQKSKGVKISKPQRGQQNEADEPMSENQDAGKCFFC